MATSTLTLTVRRAMDREGQGNTQGGTQNDRPQTRPDTRLRWQRLAACRQTPTRLFFPAGNFARMEEKQAKAVCAACPVRVPCLAFALEHDEPFGVWGRLSPEERRTLVAQDRRALAAAVALPERRTPAAARDGAV
jgi:WhiB family transcriptional regulator, redox-sensing transcriptional regulator